MSLSCGHAAAGAAGSIFTFARDQMAERWRLLRLALSRSPRFSHQPLQGRGGQDLWSGSAREPTPAYLWLRCNDRPVSWPLCPRVCMQLYNLAQRML
jgi:hypothetical protein